MVVTLQQLEVFLLILARIVGIFIQAPVYNSRSIPAMAKVALALWISAVLWFSAPVSWLPDSALLLILMIVNEVAIGFLIGFVCQILFTAIQAGGEIIDLQMGLSIATSLDPSTGTVTSIVGRMAYYIEITIFLIINGHHMILAALNQSFRLIPIGTFMHFSGPLISQLINAGASLLLIAVQLSTPALVIIFLSDFAFGIVSRVAPQVNVFMLGFQVKPSLGLLVIIFTLPLLISHISSIMGQMASETIRMLTIIK